MCDDRWAALALNVYALATARPARIDVTHLEMLSEATGAPLSRLMADDFTVGEGPVRTSETNRDLA